MATMDRSAIVSAVAKVAVGAGLRTRAGDLVIIDGSVIHRDLMLAAASECWKRGAKFVHLRYRDEVAFRQRVDLAPEEGLDEVPALLRGFNENLASERWTRLVVHGDEDPAMLEGADVGRLDRITSASQRASKAYSELMMTFSVPWCIVPYPTDAWARLVTGSPEAKGEELWPLLLEAMRMDGASEAGVLAHFDSLSRRAEKLEALDLGSLHFSGPGTDLVVGLSPAASWMGGNMKAPGGREFTANIPTEEIFTTPDFRRTEGRVACTRPVMVMDLLVEGAWLEFKGGVVVASGAKRNGDALERYLAKDLGTRRLGEVALVDCSSPIWRSGRLFRNTLLDENAACHIALGHGIAACFEGAAEMDAAAREAAGYNESLGHEDLMIGSDEIDVTGRTKAGGEVPVIRKGRFAL